MVEGDESVTPAEIDAQESLSRFAKLRKAAADRKVAKAEEAARVSALQSLRAEVLRDAPADGKELLRLVDQIIGSSNQLFDAANAHSERVRVWTVRARELGVPETGSTSADHANLGVASGPDILVDDIRIPQLDPKNLLRLLFVAVENGIVPTSDPERIEGARNLVANIGKEWV